MTFCCRYSVSTAFSIRVSFFHPEPLVLLIFCCRYPHQQPQHAATQFSTARHFVVSFSFKSSPAILLWFIFVVIFVVSKISFQEVARSFTGFSGSVHTSDSIRASQHILPESEFPSALRAFGQFISRCSLNYFCCDFCCRSYSAVLSVVALVALCEAAHPHF